MKSSGLFGLSDARSENLEMEIISGYDDGFETPILHLDIRK